MPFHIGESVVHTAHGVGYVVSIVNKKFFDLEARSYYEISIERSTVWVPVGEDASGELRAVTARAALDHYRNVLRARPTVLSADYRQRRLEMLARLRTRTFQNVCEIVRDLTALNRVKPLSEVDNSLLRKARECLRQEWASAAGVSLPEATREIDDLLLAGRDAGA